MSRSSFLMLRVVWLQAVMLQKRAIARGNNYRCVRSTCRDHITLHLPHRRRFWLNSRLFASVHLLQNLTVASNHWLCGSEGLKVKSLPWRQLSVVISDVLGLLRVQQKQRLPHGPTLVNQPFKSKQPPNTTFACTAGSPEGKAAVNGHHRPFQINTNADEHETLDLAKAL